LHTLHTLHTLHIPPLHTAHRPRTAQRAVVGFEDVVVELEVAVLPISRIPGLVRIVGIDRIGIFRNVVGVICKRSGCVRRVRRVEGCDVGNIGEGLLVIVDEGQGFKVLVGRSSLNVVSIVIGRNLIIVSEMKQVVCRAQVTQVTQMAGCNLLILPDKALADDLDVGEHDSHAEEAQRNAVDHRYWRGWNGEWPTRLFMDL
ncbi:hypothetical protein B484DRAFT_281289, partial [Ochromonadaceae sp. CCMP2298]